MINLDRTFAALADPKRRTIVARLVRGDATVSELAEPFGISRPAIFRHLKILENASLITHERRGNNPKCHLRRETLTGAAEWIDFHRTFWNGSFDWLRASFEQTKKSKKRRSRSRTLCA
jgi:DNA-binding transcriptional ArsR family regulator